jgi:two-component system nitrate/nitrite response regulator NarL
VLVLVASGQDNDQVARTLVISPETVRTHMQNALAKLGLHSRLEAASFVIRTGVLDELEPTG